MSDQRSSPLVRYRSQTAAAVAVAIATVGVLFAPLVTAAVGLPALAVAAAVLWGRWRDGGSSWGGAPVLIYAAGCLAYVLGSIPLADEAPFADTISEAQWNLYAWSALSAAIGLLVGLAVRRPARVLVRGESRTTSTRSYPAWIVVAPALVGLSIVWTNFLTGTIPLLESSINDARRTESGALLAQWSFASYSSLEFAIMAAAVLPATRLRGWMRLALIVAATGTLILTGSRSFLVFPVIVLAFIVVESVRPRLWIVTVAAGALALAIGVAGQLRSIASGSGGNIVANAERWGYGPPITASLWNPLQVGPHVFAAIREVIPADIPHQLGVFFLRDFPKLSAGKEADYWIASDVLGRDTGQTGGLPPTLLGGLFVDWGTVGTVIAVAIIFALLMVLRPAAVAVRRSQPSNLAYGILCAYVLQSYYSYVSLNASVVVMFLWCVAVILARRLSAVFHRSQRRRRRDA